MNTAQYAKKLKRMEDENTVDKLSRYLSSYFGDYLKDKTISVLDVGCGIGHYMLALKNMGIQNIKGFDINSDCIEECRKRGLNVVSRDVLKEPSNKADEKYDLVIVFDVIEHLPRESLQAFLKNVLSYVGKGGSLIVRTPSMHNPFALATRYIDLTHRNGFTEESLRQLMDELGIENYQFRYTDIYVVSDRKFSSSLMKMVAKVVLRCFEFLFKLYYYVYNNSWKRMELDIVVIIPMR